MRAHRAMVNYLTRTGVPYKKPDLLHPTSDGLATEVITDDFCSKSWV